jgi:uncharacterized RDD family membrane protein YckC
MNWYYVEAGQQAGPVSEAELLNLAQTGKVQPDTLVWCEGMANWLPYREARPGAGTTAPAATPAGLTLAASPASAGASSAAGSGAGEVVCVECGNIFSKDNAIQYGTSWVCANCKPTFVQKLKEGASLPVMAGTMDYGGFWIRLGAKFIDSLIVGAVVGIPMAIFIFLFVIKNANARGNPAFAGVGLGIQLIAQFFSVAAQLVYNGFFLGKYGATPGKMACGLKVVTPEGSAITYGRAFGGGAIRGRALPLPCSVAATNRQSDGLCRSGSTSSWKRRWASRTRSSACGSFESMYARPSLALVTLRTWSRSVSTRRCASKSITSSFVATTSCSA